MRPRGNRNAQNDSDMETSESDSDVSMDDGTVTTSVPAVAKRGRGRPKGSKKQRMLDEPSNDRDQSPQPSTSGLGNSQRIPSVDTQDSDVEQAESSGEETPDSDYMPVDDDDGSNQKLGKKRGRPPARVSPRKKKNKPNYSSKNGKTSYQNGTAGVTRLNSNSQLQGASQSKETLDPNLIESLAQKCVYFLLIDDQRKYAIRKKAIMTHVFKDENYSPKLYNAVIMKANAILMKTFSLELFQLENQKDSYMLINVLKRELGVDEYVEFTRTKHQQHGLILYLLTVIFMNGNCITEDELTKAMKPLGIDLTAKKPHPVFGDVKKYITNELVKQLYLNYECVSKDPPRYEFSWGLRALQEVDKKDLLTFACQIMDDTTPDMWILQYKDAEESARPM